MDPASRHRAARAARSVYTVRLETAIYVLHAFRKKSTRGIATSRRDIALIKARLARALEMEAERVAP